MSWTRATVSKTAPWAACALALLLVGAATFSRPWHALEFKTFDVLTALSAPQRTDLPVVILAIALGAWTGPARLARAEVLSIRERDYVAAARVIGTRCRDPARHRRKGRGRLDRIGSGGHCRSGRCCG